MTVTATSQLSPPDYPTEPGHSPEPDTTPLPRKETHRLRKALVATTAVVAVGAISFLAVSLSSATNSEAHYKGQLQAANGVIRADNATIKANRATIKGDNATIKTDNASIGTDNKNLAQASADIASYKALVKQLDATNTQDQQTISNLQGQLSVQDEVPPGGYAAFQDQLLEGLSSQYSISASTVDCVLPSTWTPGDQFNCDAFDSNSNYMGNSTITIESNAPDGSPAWEYNWYPADSGFGDD
jgi:hypothetical protein